MQLLTQAILKALPKRYATEGIPLKDKKVICKFFTPDANWSWFVFEGEKEDDDFVFFGMVHGFEREVGYFTLDELKSIRGPLGLPIERDRSVFNVPYGELIAKAHGQN